MTAPILTLFNNKGGVGKTSIVFHLAWAMAAKGLRVLAADLDPQANLTSAFLEENLLENLWMREEGKYSEETADTIYRCLKPLAHVGDLKQPVLHEISTSLALIPGDLGLSDFEDNLSEAWPHALGQQNPFRPYRVLTAFWHVLRLGAAAWNADLVLMDVGPNLGAINRSALIATDAVVVPLGADLFSLQGMRNLGPTLNRWRADWDLRLQHWQQPKFELPSGKMEPIGYVVQQHSVRLDRPVRAYDKWVNRIPEEFRRSLRPDDSPVSLGLRPDEDSWCLATMKHYRSLVPMGQETRKPIFDLTSADGAIGNHAKAVASARRDYQDLVQTILTKMQQIGLPSNGEIANIEVV